MTSHYQAWVLDLDGVIWIGDEPIPGAAAAVESLRQAGRDVVFVTNMSALPTSVMEEKLARHQIDAKGSVFTSAMAGASLVEPGERVYVVGGSGINEACEARGATVVTSGPADAVVAGMDFDFNYDSLSEAMNVVRGGARLIGTNHDPSYPTPDGLRAGGGSMVMAIAYAAEVEPIFAGKPAEAAANLVRSRLGSSGIMVGDRPDSDGLFAGQLGYDFGLVLTGVVGRDDLPVDPAPNHIAASLAELVNDLN